MIVALNVELAYSHPTGMGRYARELVSAFKAKDRGVEFLALTAQGTDAGADQSGSPGWWHPRPLPFSRRRMILSSLAGFEIAPGIRADLYHDFASSRLLPIRPYIVTVHDAAVVEQPDAYAWHSKLLHRLQMPRIRRAAAIITVSHAAKTSLIERLGLPSDQIHVIHNGVAADFFPADPQLESPDGTKPPYVMFMGVDNSRKNLGTLLRAFRLFLDRNPDCLARLMIIGPTGISAEANQERIAEAGLSSRVDRPAYLPIAELRRRLWEARALMFPSVSEGFGLPVLEAMASGCPVFCSDIPVLREVGGDAARYVAARSVESWTSALEEVFALAGPRRVSQVQAGIARAKQFSWSNAADAICKIYRTVGARSA